MAVKPDDQYNPVPSVSPQTGAPNDYLSVRANSNTFGANVGGAIEKAGAQEQQGIQQTIDLGIQRQGMLNETWAANALSKQNQAIGDVDGWYKSLTGPDAVAAHDTAIAKVTSIRQDILKSAPNPAAARAFDLGATRAEGFTVRDYGTYAGNQIKQGRVDANAALLNQYVQSASDPSVVADPTRFGNVIGNVKNLTALMVADKGYGPDPETGINPTGMKIAPNGDLSFADTPLGRQAQAVATQYTDKTLGEVYSKAYDIKAFDPKTGNIQNAMNWLQANKEKIPSETYALLLAKSSAPYRSAMSKDIGDTVFSKAEADYQTSVSSNNSSSIPKAEDVGASLVKAIPGLVITGEGRTPDQNASVNGVKNSDHLQDHALDIRPIPGMSFDEFKQKVINSGQVPANSQFLDETKPGTPNSTAPHWHVGWGGQYSGSAASNYQTKADFYSQHYNEYAQKIRGIAEAQFPGDVVTQDSAVQHGLQRMNETIQTQNIQDHAQIHSIFNYVQDPKNGINSLTQLMGSTTPPDIRNAYIDQSVRNAYGMQNLEKLFTANSKGPASTYGTDFWSNYQNVMSGKIQNATDLLSSLDDRDGKGSPLTNTGLKVLSPRIEELNTPEGRAFATSELQFFTGLHNQATGQNVLPGLKSPKLEDGFQKSMIQIMPLIEAGKAKGLTSAQLFTPSSPDYVGKLFEAPDIKTIENELLYSLISGGQNIVSGTGGKIDPSSYKTLDDLGADLASHKITKAEFIQIAKSRKDANGNPWVRDNPPPVPTPH